jgi:hypothetical protein
MTKTKRDNRTNNDMHVIVVFDIWWQICFPNFIVPKPRFKEEKQNSQSYPNTTDCVAYSINIIA